MVDLLGYSSQVISFYSGLTPSICLVDENVGWLTVIVIWAVLGSVKKTTDGGFTWNTKLFVEGEVLLIQ